MARLSSPLKGEASAVRGVSAGRYRAPNQCVTRPMMRTTSSGQLEG